jgi:hypothetical protein
MERFTIADETGQWHVEGRLPEEGTRRGKLVEIMTVAVQRKVGPDHTVEVIYRTIDEPNPGVQRENLL